MIVISVESGEIYQSEAFIRDIVSSNPGANSTSTGNALQVGFYMMCMCTV